jgi:hypothetical protein
VACAVAGVTFERAGLGSITFLGAAPQRAATLDIACDLIDIQHGRVVVDEKLLDVASGAFRTPALCALADVFPTAGSSVELFASTLRRTALQMGGTPIGYDVGTGCWSFIVPAPEGKTRSHV